MTIRIQHGQDSDRVKFDFHVLGIDSAERSDQERARVRRGVLILAFITLAFDFKVKFRREDRHDDRAVNGFRTWGETFTAGDL